jgi:hypothetical protein
MKWVLLRAATAIVVAGGLYAVYLWATGREAQFSTIVVGIVAVPLMLAALRIAQNYNE